MITYPIYRGMAFMLLAVVLYSINDALIKWVAQSYHPMQIIFCRSFFTFFPLLIVVIQKLSWKGLKTEKKAYHALRASVMALSIPFYVYAFKVLPLADAYAVAYVAPLFMAIFSIPILGEKIERHSWIAICIGFSGVLVMMRPDNTVFSMGGLSALVGGILWALALVMGRKLSKTEQNLPLTLWFMLACFLMSSVFIPFYWKDPTMLDWSLFAISGFLGGIALMAITRAFSLAPASTIAPLDYLIFIFGAILGYFIWEDIPDGYVIAGALILVLSGLYLVYHEARRKPFVLVSVEEM